MNQVDTTFYDVQDDPSFDGGQVDELDGADDSFDPPALNIDEYKDYRVPVKVDGEEQWVPLAEAVNGYQRQADYTRKTQAVSQQAQELQVVAAIKAALDNDPAGTIEALAGHYGVNLGRGQTQPQPQTRPSDPWEWDDSYQSAPEPVDARYAQLEQRIAAFEQAQQMQNIERTIQSLQRTYGEAFNPQEVIARAVATGNSDLEAVFKLIDYDRRYAAVQAAQKAQQVTAQKRAAQVVSSGAGSKSSSQDGTPVRSIAGFWEASKREAGLA